MPHLAAHKALSLNLDNVFRLLTVMSTLLGWVIALGVASFLILNNVYDNWHLTRQSQLSITLLPDTPVQEVEHIRAQLHNQPDIVDIAQVPEDAVREDLAELLDGEVSFPLPIVLDATLLPTTDINALRALIDELAPTAEVDDTRTLLTTIAHGVRLGQYILAGLAGLMVGIMALLVALTVRTGLQGQVFTLSVLKFLGGTDRFLSELVIRQVLTHSLWGWLFGTCAAAGVLGLAMLSWPPLAPLVTWHVWVGLVFSPLLLPVITLFAASFTAKRAIRRAA